MNSMRLTLAAVISIGLGTSLAACNSPSPATVDAGPGPVDAPIRVDAAIDAPPPTAPTFRNPAPLTDAALASQALRLLGAPVDGARQVCSSCHAVSRQQLRYWRTLTDAAYQRCLTDLTLATPEAAARMLACFRSDDQDPSSPFHVGHLGVIAVGAALPFFEFAFQQAYGKTKGAMEFERWKLEVAMPRGAHPTFTQAEFDVVSEYLARGLPALDQTLPPETSGPTSCTPGISSEVATILNSVAQQGWRQQHRDNGLSMLGCQGAANPLGCLTTYPKAKDRPFSATWDIPGLGEARVLTTFGYSTSYWTRSSADGRFVAHGGGSGGSGTGTIFDLQANRAITVRAPYDPAFFPDNRAFMFQATRPGGPRMCNQSLLINQPSEIAFNEPECAATASGLYQHVGASIAGGDYFIASSGSPGCWTGDPALGTQTSDPPPTRDSRCKLQFEPMVANGTSYTAKQPSSITTPFEGDAVISPNSKLVVSRASGPNQTQLGYVLRKVTATPDGGSYRISATEIARYCEAGAKPAFSYDDRWLVTHHYIGALDADAQDLGYTDRNDPQFSAYRSQGAANIYVIDLRNGQRTRLTNMKPGQYALFPHFRADGWLYFLVKDRNRRDGNGKIIEELVASPAVLRLE